MRTIRVTLPGRSYPIPIERGILDAAGVVSRSFLLHATRIAVVTDSNVGPLYASRVATRMASAGFQVKVITIPAGASSKSMEMLSYLYGELLDFGLTRTDAIAALGGGVVGDLAGFAAATILRGVDFIQIPTTLLAQVDSSVGGKVAVDLPQGKNLAGAFWQPKLVLIDPETLETLPQQVFMDGMAEVVKYGCIKDSAFFDFLEAHYSRKLLMDEMEHIVATCCSIKRDVVEKDERDTGERMLLNFGHTLGHAYELAGQYTQWSHGQAVAAGMCDAAKLGVKLGITPENVPGRIQRLLERLELPTHIDCPAETYAAAIGLDKKSSGDEIRVILLEEMGKAVARRMNRQKLLEELA